jgi:peptidoglycan/LPS O-acetylase OafA/YrhL
MIYSIQYIRAIAAIFIVMTHVAGVLQPVQDRIFTPNFQEANIAFTFAAGFLFQHLSIKEPFPSFILRRVRNVLVPYVLISIPAILIYTVGGKAHPNVDLSHIPEWFLPIYLLLTGLQLGPLWFIPMIFVIYLLTPIIRHIDQVSWYYALAIPLTFVLAITLFPRPNFNAHPPQAALHYLPIFLIGMACSQFNGALGPWLRKRWVWGPALGLLVTLGYLSSLWNDAMQFPVKTVMLICMFIVASRAETMRFRTIDIMATYSFGIFFLHGYLVAALKILEERGLFDVGGAGLDLILITALVCLGCVVVILVTKWIFGRHSRYLVGA